MPPKRGGPNRTLDILSSIGDQDFLGCGSHAESA